MHGGVVRRPEPHDARALSVIPEDSGAAKVTRELRHEAQRGGQEAKAAAPSASGSAAPAAASTVPAPNVRHGRGVVVFPSLERVDWLLSEISVRGVAVCAWGVAVAWPCRPCPHPLSSRYVCVCVCVCVAVCVWLCVWLRVCAPTQLWIAAGRSKNTVLLRRCAQLVRCLHGARIVSCKSAKDRTSMSVTLEQARLLQEYHQLRESDVPRVTELMRRHGVRRLNAEKNIGQARYAFNTLQQALLPAEFRPPPGTGGGSHT